MMLLVYLFTGIMIVTAQNRRVTGTVISDEDGEPIIGATVMVKDTKVGTVTDIDGKFTINNVPEHASRLVVSYVGMTSQEVEIAPNVSVSMRSNSELLDEVIVTGYGNFSKTNFTGSASTVNTSKLEDSPYCRSRTSSPATWQA